MKKFIILLIMVLLLTGCTANYNIKINFNKSVEESFNFVVTQDILQYTDMGDSPSDFATSFIDIINQKNGGTDYHSSRIIGTNNMGFKVRKTYKNINYLATYSSFSDYLYRSITVDTEGSHVTIHSNGDFKTTAINCEWCNYPQITDSYISVRLPYKVITNNADEVDDDKNIYSWKLGHDKYPASINLEYDTAMLYSYNLLDWLPFLNYYVVFFVLLGIIAIITLLYLRHKSNKNNMI